MVVFHIMPKPRLAIIGSGSEISWVSCQSISQNLSLSYTMLSAEYEIRFFNLNIKTSSKIISGLKVFSPNKILFLDHVPLYFLILKDLDRLFPKKKPPLLFHLYGDFSLNIDLWLQAEEDLKKWSIQFLCASPKYSAFVTNFLRSGRERIQTCPFPVNTESFVFDSGKRKDLRKKHKILSTEKVWLYVGRMSLQKNIDRLILEFAKSFQKNRKQVLVLIGDYDDLGLYFIGLKTPLGYTYHRIQKIIKGLPKEVQKKILYFPQSSLDVVRNWYSAADVFCSLSLYHDEDFGMAPAEALSCGLPVVLTDWGGYSQFKKNSLPCQLISVRLTKDAYSLSSKAVQRAVDQVSICDKSRSQTGALFAEHFSPRVTSQRLKHILQLEALPFLGFTKVASLHNHELRQTPQYPLTVRSHYAWIYGESFGQD